MTVSYPRRQRCQRLMTAASRAAGAAVAFVAATLAVAAGEALLGLLLALLAGILVLEGWHVRHGVDWPGRGDLDHVVRSPSGMGFVIETKTLRYSPAHVVRTIDAARWLARKRRRYPCGALPVVCVTRARRVERFEEEVLVVSLDRLIPALRQTRPLRRRSWSTRRSHERETADHRPAPRG